ncbi:MAG: hypothetical protein MUF50_02895 [Planctomycetes bacterium]|jgi:hypothetical protein|nr:hypothetical protein [Planctomycetota bacterium]
MKTITQIGKASLLKIFKPLSKIDAMEERYVTVQFPKEEFNLLAPIKANYDNHHWGDLQFRSGTDYMFWGVALGLITIEVKNEKSILDSIKKNRLRGFFPSHLIVKNWSNGDMGGEHEDYIIYRLSPKQEQSIRCKVFDLIMEPEKTLIN